MTYPEFLASKTLTHVPTGLEIPADPHSLLFDFQRDIVRWALRRGRAAIFADCGLGKTLMQLEWARQVPGKVLILTPLAVAEQTVREGEKLGLTVTLCARQEDVRDGVNVTNYEKLHHFDASAFQGIVLDESSILKSFTGKTRCELIEAFEATPFRLCCTATPAPNDYVELGNHSEFLGVVSRAEMLSMFFVHDGGRTSNWRLKGHAQNDFWKWICSWAVSIRKPSDLGYEDGGFVLPDLAVEEVLVAPSPDAAAAFPSGRAESLTDRRKARQSTLLERVAAAAARVNASNEQWLVWCDLNAESDALAKAIRGAVEVTGSDSSEVKLQAIRRFESGEARVLVTKPSIAGFGMNWQHCRNTAFVGLSDSYEAFYQAVRRCWRFGQQHPVKAFIFTSSLEGATIDNIERKEIEAQHMQEQMVRNTSEITGREIRETTRVIAPYKVAAERGDAFEMRLGDCVEAVREIPSDSVHFSIFSPPFASLYTYSASDRDMGNCKDGEEFARHFGFLITELYRVLMPGRLVAFHCMNLPTSKARDGIIGIRDFRGELIRSFSSAGFIFHSEVCIWKNPVTAMQRTKALGLLHKQMLKDSCMSRQGIPDYLVVMRKPGDNPERVSGPFDTYVGDGEPITAQFTSETDNRNPYSIQVWQRYASPVWMDINPSDTLQKRSAREHEDERHICPLQLQVIERALELWTNPGDLVLSPFAGIGSEGYVALQKGRRFLGVELKESYFKQAVLNLTSVAAPAIELKEAA